MPEWFGSLTRLRTLDLGHNRLTSVPDLSALTDLDILYLHDNALRVLPPLPESLTYLNVGENPLDALSPLSLPRLIELRALDAGLDSLPSLELPRLRELHLRGNRFTEVPESVRSLRALRLLDLRANRLASVPDWLAELPDLQKLDLRWNELYEPPEVPPDCVVLTE